MMIRSDHVHVRPQAGHFRADTDETRLHTDRLMTQVRPFTSSDIPPVADLFLKVFGKDAQYPLSRDEVARSLADVFLDHPWRHEPLTSYVCETSRGTIAGFLGVTPRRMRFKGRSILVVVIAHHMVDPVERGSHLGLHLLRSLLAGPQDLTLTDGATDQGMKIWTRLGGMVAVLPSMTWLRPLRPAALAAAAVRSKYPMLAPCTAAARPCASVIDSVLVRRGPHRFRRPRSASEAEASDLDPAAILTGITELSEDNGLRPDYDSRAIEWLVARAGGLVAPGALQKAVVRNGQGKMLGWYLYHLNPAGVSEVLQIVATRGAIGKVFNHLCYDAWTRGALGLGGRVDASLLETVGLNDCILACGNPWVVAHSRDTELLQNVCQGRAWFTRLDGEWCTSVRT
jgi:hypothetical protein